MSAMCLLKKRSFLLALGLLLAAPLLAAPLPTDTLATLLEQAWAKNPQASALTARETENSARTAQAQARIPGAATVSFSHLNDVLTGYRGRQEWEAELSAPLWLPGQQAAQQQEAARAQSELAAYRQALRLELAGALRTAWANLSAARDLHALAQGRVNSARALEQDVLRRYHAGEAARSDANLAQSERLDAETAQLETGTALALAEQALRTLTGQTTVPLTLAAESGAENTQAAPTGNGDAIRPSPEDPLRDHPRLAALNARLHTARAHLASVRQNRREAPELGLRVLRERADGSEGFAHALGIKLSLPLTFGPNLRREEAAAHAEILQAEAELAQASLHLQAEVERAKQQQDTLQRQLTLIQEQQRLSADNLALAEKAYALGEFDLNTLLRNRAAAQESAARLARTQNERAAAQSSLMQALGVLP